jgi:predicted HAD superfamily Cof-like phosphohydrolase
VKSDHQKRVEELMRRAGQDVPSRPFMPSALIRKLRANLILEEALETIEALGFDVIMRPFDNTLVLREAEPPDLVKIVDGCADTIVVTTGTLSACGVRDQPILEAVDLNNLGKFGPGSYRREDGKWMKPPGHVPPDLRSLLEIQSIAPEEG